MSPRHHIHLHPLRTLLALLLAAALCLLAAGAPAGATGHQGAHHRHRACAAHAKRHPRACHAKARRHSAVRVATQPVQSNAALLASILATPCANTGLTPDAGNLQAVTAATLCLVNQERARHSELPLALNAQLAQAADGHSREMVSDDYFAHVAPSGLTPLQRVRSTGYIPSAQDGYTIGENIAWGTLNLSTPQAIVAAWIASPEHLANILEARYTDTAIGVTPQAPASLSEGQDGAVYSQEFGVIVR